MLKVRVVTHKAKIVIVPHEPTKDIDKEWHPTTDGRLGCVLGNTKSNLGVSQEALDLLNQVEIGRDDIGDLDWWWCANETYAFSWFGPIFRIINPATAVTARGFKIYREQCVIIANEVPEKARQVVESDPKTGIWDEPYAV